MTFENFGLAAPLLRAVAEENHHVPTPIQGLAIPPAIAGRDVIGIAQTGTGKTAAFVLPILNRLVADGHRARPGAPRALILSPTRELSGQIAERIGAYGRHSGLSVTLVIGGVSMGPQKRALAGTVDVVVATPGRLLDLMNARAVDLRAIEILVLDEADRMLDMGFIRDIRKIVAAVPAKRQTMLFSATMPREIRALADAMTADPEEVAANPVGATATRVEQKIVLVDRAAKPSRLVKLLGDNAGGRILVFTRTKRGADRVVQVLGKAQIKALAIHGNKSQNQREGALKAFRSDRAPILVATDIAARGIDVTGIDHVINYDLPNIAETYVHRIGRTGRAGASGRATSFCTADEFADLKAIEKLVGAAIPSVDERVGEAHVSRPAAPQAAVKAPKAARTEGGRAKPQAKQGRRRRSRGNGSGRPDKVDPVAFLMRPRRRSGERNGRPDHRASAGS